MTNQFTVLVVDDDPGIRETMWDILTLEGYQVELAESGEEAVAKCRAKNYDVALLDISMPGMNGVEALRQIKRITPSIRAIMITGLETGDLVDQSRAAGAEAVFRKPLDVATFLPMLLMS